MTNPPPPAPPPSRPTLAHTLHADARARRISLGAADSQLACRSFRAGGGLCWLVMDSGALVLTFALALACSPPSSRVGNVRDGAGSASQGAGPKVPHDDNPRPGRSSEAAQHETPPCIEQQPATQFCMLYLGSHCTDSSDLFAEMNARFEGARKGRCGGATVISYVDPIGAMEFFFDDAHGLVAARHRADTNRYCKSSSFTAWFGAPRPECTSLREFTVADFARAAGSRTP